MQAYTDSKNKLSTEEIAKLDLKGRIGKEIFFFHELTSTFDKIKDIPCQDGTAVVCSRQTNGVGRLGREWESNTGGIYLTFALKSLPWDDGIQFMPIACALGVCTALNEYVPCEIKWPNDIVYRGKKLCGILAKNLASSGKVDEIYTGIGINANNHFSENLPYAVSLKMIVQNEVNENLILEGVLNSIDSILFGMTREEILISYKKYCVNIGKEITVVQNGTELKGICTDILPDGSMEFCSGGKILSVNSGEASVKGIYTKGNI
jgi:BirA family biotin operon repressor/biotin-[acetyl-CoA-carboxylase] ligase